MSPAISSATPPSYLGERFEFKYILTQEERIRIESEMPRLGLRKDPFAQASKYIVNSIYYETPRLDDYRDKDGSLLQRKKLRVRMYQNSWDEPLDVVWFEVKKKNNFYIAKNRAPVGGVTWEEFFGSNSALVLVRGLAGSSRQHKEHLHAFLRYFVGGNFCPHIAVRYFRNAYLGDFVSRVRITFDSSIQVSPVLRGVVQERRALPVHYGATIMEVKFQKKLPWWFSDLIRRYDLRRTDFSKYTYSVDQLRMHQRLVIPR